MATLLFFSACSRWWEWGLSDEERSDEEERPVLRTNPLKKESIKATVGQGTEGDRLLMERGVEK